MAFKRKAYRKKRAPAKKRTYKSTYKKRRVTSKAAVRRVAKAVTLSLRTIKKAEETIVSQPWGNSPALTPNAALNGYVAGQPSATGLDSGGHLIPGHDATWTMEAANHWTVHNPLYLAGTSNYDSLTMREDNKIYARNTLATWDLKVSPKIAQCFRMRIIRGFYKGDSHTAQNNLGHVQMNAMFPRWNSKLNPADGTAKQFSIQSDTCRTYTPHQVYDSNWSDDTTSNTEALFGQESIFAYEGEELTNALWKPISGKISMKFDRTFMYESDQPQSLMGANPFIAYAIYPCDLDFKTVSTAEAPLNQAGTGAGVSITAFHEDGSTGTQVISANDTSQPSPALTVTYQTFFADVK